MIPSLSSVFEDVLNVKTLEDYRNVKIWLVTYKTDAELTNDFPESVKLIVLDTLDYLCSDWFEKHQEQAHIVTKNVLQLFDDLDEVYTEGMEAMLELAEKTLAPQDYALLWNAAVKENNV